MGWNDPYIVALLNILMIPVNGLSLNLWYLAELTAENLLFERAESVFSQVMKFYNGSMNFLCANWKSRFMLQLVQSFGAKAAHHLCEIEKLFLV